MPENKRWVERYSVDLKVRFGQKLFSENGRVQDISMFGFCIETPEVLPKGSLLKVQLLTPDKNFISVIGTVKWSLGVCESKDGLKWGQQLGMGIEIKQFLEGREVYKKLCQEYWKKGTGIRPLEKEKTAGSQGR